MCHFGLMCSVFIFPAASRYGPAGASVPGCVWGQKIQQREEERERVCTGARQYEQAIDTNTIIHPWLYTVTDNSLLIS